jgi:hypothetical protein
VGCDCIACQSHQGMFCKGNCVLIKNSRPGQIIKRIPGLRNLGIMPGLFAIMSLTDV